MIIERNKGYGTAVIQDMIETYKNSYNLIYCFVDAKNTGAIKLYKQLGKVYDEDGPNINGEYYVTFYDDGTWKLNEDKKNNSSKSMVVQQTNTEDKRRLEAVQKYCVPISSIIDTIPDKVGAYEVVASNNFIEDFSKYCKKHKDVVEKAKEKLTMALANMTNGIPKAQTDILSVSGPKKFWELKVGRFRDKQELRAIYFTEDITGLNRKFFILGSFFIHADKKFTGDEKKSAVGTYQNIINY